MKSRLLIEYEEGSKQGHFEAHGSEDFMHNALANLVYKMNVDIDLSKKDILTSVFVGLELSKKDMCKIAEALAEAIQIEEK